MPPTLTRAFSLGDETPRIGKLVMPRAACLLADGKHLVVVESGSSQLPVLSLDGTVVRQLVPENRAFDDPCAVVRQPDKEDALIVVDATGLTKLSSIGASKLSYSCCDVNSVSESTT